jgi:hypothetical protein
MDIGDSLLGHSLGKVRDTYANHGSEGLVATASQETADWVAAAMEGKKPKVRVKVPHTGSWAFPFGKRVPPS